MRKTAVLISLLAATVPLAVGQGPSTPAYKDPSKPIAERVRDLLGRMTLDEKIMQLQSMWYIQMLGMQTPALVQKGALNEPVLKAKLSNGLGTYVLLDDFTSPARGPREGVETRNLIQGWVIKNTRLGIPILFHGEALHGVCEKGATSFPQAIALGSTWDPELLKRMFTAVGLEARASGTSLVLAPVLDLSRDPRYGRVEEMYSEDPYLAGSLGVAAVLGLQGDSEVIDQEHVMATAKHFVHGQPENGTNVGPSDFSERTMREVFLYPFEQAVRKARIGAVMPSYNEINGGIPSHANPWLLRQVLRKEWGFTGITVSDYLGVQQLNSLQHVAANAQGAGALALKSGVDMELPTAEGYTKLADAMRAGMVSEAEIDEAVRRVLTAKFRAGLFEHPYADPARADAVVGSKQHAELARKAADEAIVLLQNKNSILPLDASKIRTIAVIGPNADKVRQGTYSGVPPYFMTVLEGIRKRVGAGIRVVYAEGCRISEPDKAPLSNFMAPYQAPSEEADRKLIKEAVEAAASADVVVLVLGGNEVVSRESIGRVLPGMAMFGDTDTLELPGRQNELAAAVATVGKPVVAVLLNGRPYSIGELTKQALAILEGFYLGQETGNAVAGVLFGDVNPSGRLAITIARNVGQLPVYYYMTPAARRGYVFNDNTPLFPFGFGLSYTTFSYGIPVADQPQISTSGSTKVKVTVSNTGARAGDEVVQMYVHHRVSSVVQPVIALRGFKRIHLEPGRSETVTFEVGTDELSILDANMRRVVEPGKVDVLVGPNSTATSAVHLTVVR
jgi:beta-glucosidase